MAAFIIRALLNPFVAGTRNSRLKAVRLMQDHWYRLKSKIVDPFINSIFVIFDPLFTLINISYIQYQSLRTECKVNTILCNAIFKRLGQEKAPYWKSEILKIFPETSRQYMELFPNGLKDFYTGSRENILNFLAVFYRKIVEFEATPELQEDVYIFYTEIKSMNDDHNVKHESLKSSSEKVNDDITKGLNQMHGNMGLLINKYQDDTSIVATFFDFDMLRRPMKDEPDIYLGSVPPLQTKKVFDRTFEEKSQIILYNTGSTDLSFCLAPTPDTQCHDIGIILQKGQQQTVSVKDLGSINNKYINCTNLSSYFEGYYSVTDLV